MALSKYILPHPLLRRQVLPAFSSLRHLPTEDLFDRFWNNTYRQHFLPHFDHPASNNVPVYQVSEDDKKFSISVDLPGVRAEDMQIKLLDNNILHLSGGRKFQEDDSVTERKFGYQFSLSNKNLDLEHLQAHLSDGVLKISAPIVISSVEDSARTIPILEGGLNSTHPAIT
eukprot:CAMPEP_0176174312 /NCGR_PEP_ID=MMETSP0120_2-20121206/89307_1 /TAXON_ID=160619 /ORGANISM="Kryptoperidinium foliaceum, Strain CCMP 1326" /LENGTH=170 /DNA_ID=CAMNT_0017512347 /DNA_START=661 /DNA_END=1169 /DNA_ORIENTATION=+